MNVSPFRRASSRSGPDAVAWAAALALIPALLAPNTALAEGNVNVNRAEPLALRPQVRVAALVAPDVTTLKANIRAGIDATNEDPDVATAKLRAALDAAAAAPGVMAKDSKAHAVRIEGLLTLARAYLVLEQRDKAIPAVDEAIRISRGDMPPIKEFGPSLEQLYAERLSAPELRPVGSVHVACTSPCRVILDGRTAGTGADFVVTGIPIGEHTIRLEPQSKSATEFQQDTFVVTDRAREKKFSYDPPVAASGGGGAVKLGAPDTEANPSGRKMPRWAGILGVSVGLLAVVGGVVLLALDGTCPDGEDPDGDMACRDVLENTVSGSIVLAGGGAALVGFGIGLGVGEAKDKRHRNAQPPGTEAVLKLRFRF